MLGNALPLWNNNPGDCRTIPRRAGAGDTKLRPESKIFDPRRINAARAVILFTAAATVGLAVAMDGRLLTGIGLALGSALYLALTRHTAVAERDDSPHHTAVTAGDLLLITAVVWLTGGLSSEYYLLYYLPVIQAGIRLNSRDGIAACLLGCALYAFVAVAGSPVTAGVSPCPFRLLSLGVSAIALVVLFTLLKREVNLYEQLRNTMHTSLRRVAAIYDVAHTTNAGTDLGGVLSIILDHAARATGALNGSISLLFGDDQLRPMASLSTRAGDGDHPTSFCSEPARKAIETDSVVTITSLDESAGARQGSNIVYLPLATPGGPIGVLALVSRPGRRLAARHLEFLRSLTTEAALAIENARLRTELRRLAVTDYLTGLPNRREIERRLTDELAHASKTGSPVAVLMIDVDNLKQINDQFGHVVGDEVICALARRLETAIRSSEAAARLGGDEFLVVLPESDVAQGVGLADRLIATFPGVIKGRPALPDAAAVAAIAGISIGVAATHAGRLSPKDLLAAADGGLYHAKRAGKNRSAAASASEPPLEPAAADSNMEVTS